MFDLIFDALQAWNQIGLLIMALVFLLIGGGILADFFYWRIKGQRVKGRITGVRVKGKGKNKPTQGAEHIPNPTKASNEPKETLGQSFKKQPVAISFGGLFALMFIGFPLLFSGIGVWMGYTYYSLTASGNWAQGEIIRNDSSYDSESGTSYKAVLHFQDKNGRTWEVKDTISYGSSPSFEQGTQVGLYYNPANPKKFVIDDFWHNMAIAVAFFAFGIGFVGIIFLALYFNTKTPKPSAGGKFKKQNFANEYYYPVFEYMAQDGTRKEYNASMGSNMLLGNLPGREVSLLVIPGEGNHSDKVRRKGVLGLVFGLVFFAPGVLIGNIAVTSFEFNPVMFLMVLGIIGLIAFKLLSVAPKIKKAYHESKEMGAFKKENFKFRVTSRSKNEGRLLEKSEIDARLPGARTQVRIGGYFSLIIALGLFIGAYYAAQDMSGKLENGVRTEGEVVRIESRYDSSSEGSGYTYYAVVEFKGERGRRIEFRDSVGSSHPIHKRGDAVDVIYNPDKPSDAIIDRGWMNWLLSGGLALGGLVLLWACFHAFRRTAPTSRRFARRV